jgi:hypothetical protein
MSRSLKGKKTLLIVGFLMGSHGGYSDTLNVSSRINLKKKVDTNLERAVITNNHCDVSWGFKTSKGPEIDPRKDDSGNRTGLRELKSFSDSNRSLGPTKVATL